MALSARAGARGDARLVAAGEPRPRGEQPEGRGPVCGPPGEPHGPLQVARWRDTLDEKTLATEKARDAALDSAEAAERAVRDLATTKLRELVKALEAYEGAAQATLLAKKVDQCLDVALLENVVEDELRCSACGLNPRTVAIFDCGHLCLCSDCAPAVVDCPVCNQHARETRRVFLG